MTKNIRGKIFSKYNMKIDIPNDDISKNVRLATEKLQSQINEKAILVNNFNTLVLATNCLVFFFQNVDNIKNISEKLPRAESNLY